MSLCKDFLRWYYNKDTYPAVEAVITFYHNKNTDMSRLSHK